jgi:O-antigen/teichoic acid export membrane protein
MENSNLVSKIIKGSKWNLLTSVINKLGALIFTILLARFLLPERYGLFSIVFSTVTIFFTFADLGVNQALIRYLSHSLSKDRKKIIAYYHYLFKVKLILTFITALVLLILAYPIAFFLFKNKNLFFPLLISAGYLFVLSLESFYSSIFYSIEKVNYLGIKEVISQISKILLCFFVFYFIASSYQIIGIFLTLILSSILLICFSLYYLNKLLPELRNKSKESLDKKRIRRFIGYTTIASISAVFFSYIDSILLAFFLSPDYVGYYRASFSLVNGIIGLLAFPNIVLLALFTKSDKTEVKRVLERGLRYLAILSIPASFGLAILGRYFLVTLFGYSYLEAYLPLYVLSFLIFPIAAVGLFLSFFSAEESPEIFAKLIVITSIINITLNILLIKIFLVYSSTWAMFGAAIATLLSWVFYFFLSTYHIKKDFKVPISFSILIKPVFASIIMSLILIYSIQFIKNMNILYGVLEIFLGIFVYTLVLLIIGGIKKDDFNLLNKLF